MKLFQNIISQDRSLRGETNPTIAMNKAFCENNDNEFSDVENILDKYCFANRSLEDLKSITYSVGSGIKATAKNAWKVTKATSSMLSNLAERIAHFTDVLVTSVKDKVVTEKYIHEKFDKISYQLRRSSNMRCYVRDVPTYSDLITRLNGIIQAAEYIKSLASQDDTEDGLILMQQLIVKSKGVITIEQPKKASSFANIVWQPAELQEFDIRTSKYGDQHALDNLKNLILHCKYGATDNLIEAAKIIEKRAKEASGDDLYDAGNYALVYTVGKIVKQFYREAIQKEINMIVTVYCYRLTKYIDK